MTVEETQPEHTAQELSVVQDVLGTYSTSFAGSSYNRIENIKNGAAKLMRLSFIREKCFHLRKK